MQIWEKVNKVLHMFSPIKPPFPATVMIDPVNTCQLRCPLCPTGTGNLGYENRVMSLDLFKLVLEKMPFVRTVNLFKSGEPFLNPDLLAMIRYANDRKIKVITSTNFSFHKDDDFFKELVMSGLKKLIVSIDGASTESYSMYRRGGDYSLVVSNLKRLAETKKELRSKSPKIIWQFLVNKYNEHEIDDAEIIANELGITIDIQPIGLADDMPDYAVNDTINDRKGMWLPKNQKHVYDHYKGYYKFPLYKGVCKQLFTRTCISPDARIFPCCWTVNSKSVFGDLISNTFEDIWHNEKYTSARSYFVSNGISSGKEGVCSNCNNFSRSSSLQERLKLITSIWFGFWQ